MKKLLLLLLVSASVSLVGRAAPDASAIWGDNCAKCHGPDGKGNTKMGHKLKITDLTDPAVQASFKDEDVVKAIKDGVTDKQGVKKMKAIEGLSDADAQAMIKYVRALKA